MQSPNLIRFKQRFESLLKAYKLLYSATKKSEFNDLEKAGLSQTFMFNFELFWKCLKDYLEYKGYENKASRDVLKNAFTEGLIDSDIWFEILDNRNLLSHTYTTLEIDKIVELIKNKYFPVFEKLYFKLKDIYEMGA